MLALYPGSFDPFTKGHLDVAERALAIFGEVHIAVVHNPAKQAQNSLDERVAAIREAIPVAAVGVLESGLLVDYAKRIGADVLVKGLRNSTDVESELAQAKINKDLSGIETLFLMADPQNVKISSTLVRQVQALGGDVSAYLPEGENNG
jgi:pantetheine-phosphate adenylyltransferase